MVQKDRDRGYVLQEGFFEAHISTIAAPVRDHTGAIVAALGATIPSPHIELKPTQLDEVVRRVSESADELSRLLDYAPEKSGASVVNLWRE
jgi:DNA-binding IclR family transcriptional regulator